MNDELSYEEYVRKVRLGILTGRGELPGDAAARNAARQMEVPHSIRAVHTGPDPFRDAEKEHRGNHQYYADILAARAGKRRLVSRMQFNEIPPHVEYALTEKGKALLPVFYAMTKWGFRYIP